MLDESVASHDDRIEIHSLTRHIRNDTDAADRSVILEMVWLVVLADGNLDSHESQLMRRLAGLLFVDDVDLVWRQTCPPTPRSCRIAIFAIHQ